MMHDEKTCSELTKNTLEIALSAAEKYDTDLIIASTTGATALQLSELAMVTGFRHKIICVTHAYGRKIKGENEMSLETMKILEKRQVALITASHVLSGAERALSNMFKGLYPVEIVAATLRMLGQGVKVCVEIALMALDGGKIAYKKPVICVAGTARGADTICLITPSYTDAFLETKIHKILCSSLSLD